LAPSPAFGRSGGLAQLLRNAARHSLLFHTRRRRHLAVLTVLALMSGFLLVAVRPRTVSVIADGREMQLQTRQSNDEAVLRQAGVDLSAGDRVLISETPGARVLTIDRARDVEILADGETYRLRTAADTIIEALDEVDVVLQQRDSVTQNGLFVSENASIDPPVLLASAAAAGELAADQLVRVEVRRAMPIVIADEGSELVTSSSRETVALALREAGISVGPGDEVIPDVLTPLEVDTRIEVRRANSVTIALPEGHRVVYTLAATVADVLQEEGIVLPAGAFVHPPFETVITSDLRVRVVQLGASNDVEYEYIESSTVYASDSDLAPGETRTVAGRDGVRTRRYDIAYVDGEEVSRELVEDVLDPEPVDTVIYYPVRSGQTDTSPAASGAVTKTLRVYASAYNAFSAGRSPDDPNYGVTASGAIVTYGIVAVDPTVIPLGTRMFIPGYGYAVAGDTGGAVKGYIIDLGFPDGVEIDWVPKWLDIYILE
jgi:uncharacterized protein YabE (DUF348 family)